MMTRSLERSFSCIVCLGQNSFDPKRLKYIKTWSRFGKQITGALDSAKKNDAVLPGRSKGLLE